LLSQGADPNIAGNRKLRALHFAVWRGHEDTVRLLLESGANPNIMAGEDEDDWKVTPFFFTKKGSSIYNLLIQFGGKEQ
jgi:ankyrin repeat protein